MGGEVRGGDGKLPVAVEARGESCCLSSQTVAWRSMVADEILSSNGVEIGGGGRALPALPGCRRFPPDRLPASPSPILVPRQTPIGKKRRRRLKLKVPIWLSKLKVLKESFKF